MVFPKLLGLRPSIYQFTSNHIHVINFQNNLKHKTVRHAFIFIYTCSNIRKTYILCHIQLSIFQNKIYTITAVQSTFDPICLVLDWSLWAWCTCTCTCICSWGGVVCKTQNSISYTSSVSVVSFYFHFIFIKIPPLVLKYFINLSSL